MVSVVDDHCRETTWFEIDERALLSIILPLTIT